MDDIKNLLDVIDRLSNIHRNWGGTIERIGENDTPKLRYFNDVTEQTEERQKWNQAVRDMDQIATQVIRFLVANGVQVEVCETPGATVMFWLLRDSWEKNRVSIAAMNGAFDLLHQRLSSFNLRSVPKPLTPNDNDLLEAMIAMGATVNSPASSKEILKQAKWKSEGKRAFTRLVEYGYVGSKSGIGYWLTSDGIVKATEITNG